MSNPSDRPLDLGSIKGPDETPSETADPKTTAEEEVYKSKALTASQAAQKSHADHLKTLQEHIAHHREACRFCQEEKNRLLATIVAEKERADKLRNDCTQLQEIAWSVRWMNLLGNIMVGGGGVSFGIAGCWPGMENHLKFSLAAGGTVAVLCGLALTILAFFAGRRANNRADPSADLTKNRPL